MRKRPEVYVTAVLVILGFLLVGFGGSQKIGLVDLSEIISESDAGKDASAKLQGFVETKKAEVQERRDKLLQEQQVLQEQQEKLSEKELQAQQEEFAQKSREFEQFVARVRQEVRAKDKTLSDKLLPEVRKIVRGIGHREDYTMIMDINTGKIVYHTPDSEITSRVLQRFNEEYNTGSIEIEGSSKE